LVKWCVNTVVNQETVRERNHLFLDKVDIREFPQIDYILRLLVVGIFALISELAIPLDGHLLQVFGPLNSAHQGRSVVRGMSSRFS